MTAGAFAASPVSMVAMHPDDVRLYTARVVTVPAQQTQPVTVIAEANLDSVVRSAICNPAGTLRDIAGQRHEAVPQDSKAAQFMINISE